MPPVEVVLPGIVEAGSGEPDGNTRFGRRRPIRSEAGARRLGLVYWPRRRPNPPWKTAETALERDVNRYEDSLKRINVSPLGAGALAGTTFPIDREYSAELLGFNGIYENSLDAVSDRDFILEFLSNSSMIMMHLSRLCEELILWSSQEFQFIEMSDQYATGSSIMPQKKNPDVAELVRGKTGRVYGNLFGLLTVLKGLPLAYNKDLQEDKEGMFDTVKTVEGCLHIMAGMLETMTVNKEKMGQAVTQDFSNATEIADYLASKGLPFRQAHEIVGKLVRSLHAKRNLFIRCTT